MAPARIATPSTGEDSCFSPINGHFSGINGNGDGAHAAPIEDKLEPIVIVGMDLRFPQDATSAEEFWEMLIKGRSAMSPVPETRWNVDAFYHPDPERAGAMNVNGGHFLKEDIAAWDAPFFSITPNEANCMDPQQRILLENAYRALENGGIPMESVIGSKTSVFIGNFTREYEIFYARDPEQHYKYLATGTGAAMFSNRLSWFYDFTGPSLTIDTACSSSLNALHLGAQSLRSGESDMSLVGGCNLFYNPDTIISLTNLNFLSPDGICKSFDHKANGYARGEGFGVVVLKRLSDAIRDGNTIRAVIRATGSNQDGKSPGITQPTSAAQCMMIRDTYAAGGLDLKSTRYFESHGTGTVIGDPTEASAIAEVLSKDHRSSEDPLYIGAVKSNIGHLEGSAGIAGVIKTVLVLEKGVIPPNIHFEKVNPNIKVDDWNIKFPLGPTPWPTDGLRRASVNSFGYGGSNSHAVLEDAVNYLRLRGLTGKHATREYPPSLEELRCARITTQPAPQKVLENPQANSELPNGHIERLTLQNGQGYSPQNLKRRLESRIFTWSAADEAGIKRLAEVYQIHLNKVTVDEEEEEDRFLASLAHTLSDKRSSLPWKAFTVASSLTDLRHNLESGLSKPIRSANAIKLGFIFTGQGAQWHAMGRELFHYPVFRHSVQEADEYLRSIGCRWSVIDELHKDEKLSKINNPAFSQPLCAALQIGIIDLINTWGIQAAAVVGHSSGEIAAAYACGGLSRESAWKVAYHRGALSAGLAMFSPERGSMMSVGLSEAEAQRYLSEIINEGKGDISIGCINSHKNVTITGSAKKIDILKAILDEEKIFARKLKVDNAYHSSYMKEIAFEYWKEIKDITPGDFSSYHQYPKMFSSISGLEVAVDALSHAEYWVKNLVSPVRFSDALAAMVAPIAAPKKKKLGGPKKAAVLKIDHLIELGPHAALQGPTKDVLNAVAKSKNIGYMSLLRRNANAIETSLELAGRLHSMGFPVVLNTINNPGVKLSKLQMLVDLPAYPFNHSQTYWAESRVSKNFRFRKHPRHELLGVTVPDWNDLEPRWRNFLKTSENPWIKDHKITGSMLYPASGMLVMAIEAARQVAHARYPIKGFRMREVSFHKALVVPSTAEGIETNFYLRPFRESSYGSSKEWNEFRLCIYEDNQWKENCRGLVAVEYDKEYNAVDGGREAKAELQAYNDTLAQRKATCKSFVDSKQLYQLFDTIGLNFSTCFQTLKDLYYNDNGEAVASILVQDIAEKMPKGYATDHVIHPTTLDGILQLMFPALTKGGSELKKVFIPTFIKDIFVSLEGNSYKLGNDSLSACAKAVYHGFRDADSSVIAADPVTGDSRVIVKGFRTTAVTGRDARVDFGVESRRLCFNIDWTPDISLLDYKQAAKVLGGSSLESSQSLPDKLIKDLELCYFMFIDEQLKSLDDEKVAKFEPHLQRYVAWMKQTVEGANPNWKKLAQNPKFFKDLIVRVEEASPDGRLGVRCGRSLDAILRGEIDVPSLLSQDDLLNETLRMGIGADAVHEKLGNYLNALVHKSPDVQILEIGAGVGATTVPLMHRLRHHGDDEAGSYRFAHYTVTDTEESSLETARELLGDSVERMNFKVLDIEADPLQQGFEAGEYDVIIAPSTIHRSKILDSALSNARNLLKKGGKIVMSEVCSTTIRSTFVSGLLPGWWQSTEENRKDSPLITEKDWDSCLRKNKFSGVDMALPDFLDSTKVMVSTAISATDVSTLTSVPETVIIASLSSEMQQKIAHQLKFRLDILGGPICEVISPRDISVTMFAQKICIFLPELEESVLADIDAEAYSSLQKILASALGMLWITSAGPLALDKPEAELVTGLARCVRSENITFNFITLAMENVDDPIRAVNTIVQVFKHTLLSTEARTETEYRENDGVLHIGRVVEGNYLNLDIASKVAIPEAKPRTFGEEPIRPLTLSIETPGLLDTLQFIDDPKYNTPLKEGEVELEVKATGMNFLDVAIALGQVSDSFLGGECSGVITKIGKGVDLKIGDRVTGCVQGCYSTFARTGACVLAKIPNHLSFEEAAVMPIVYSTAYYSLYDVARMRKGETCLIHYAAGGVGQAAIQLANIIGAEIFATVGTEEKKQFVMEKFGVPEDHIFCSRDGTFQQGIMRMTKNRGVDVILNSVSGEGLRQTWDCIAPFGRHIEIGKWDIQTHTRLPMNQFSRNVSFCSVDLAFMGREKVELLGEILGNVMKLANAKMITAAQPLHVFPYGRIEEAFRLMQSGKQIGKIALVPHADDLVMTVPNGKPAYYLDENASYLVAGGLGGIGRSISAWMVSRGAKNLILLNRSGTKNPEAAELVMELEAQGCKILAPPCDVTKEETLAAVLKEAQETMPPIKGVIQGSMVLRDQIFENMPLEDFKAVTRPKVQGSWNLHSLCPKDLDFFICLASGSGIAGNRGQANYAVGNTYQDALCRHRVSRGLKATSLDLGMILSIGVASENESVMENLRSHGYLGIRPEELLALIEYHCNPALPLLSPFKAQVVTGMEVPSVMRAKGVEDPFWLRAPLFLPLYQMGDVSAAAMGDENAVDIGALLKGVDSLATAGAVVCDALVKKVARTLGMPVEDIDASKPMHSYGVDSLVAVEVRNWFLKEMKADVAVFDIMGSGSIADLAVIVAGKSAFVSAELVGKE